MPDRFLLAVNDWMTGGLAAAAAGCFLWGMVSALLSPCHMASIPLIAGYVGGQERSMKSGGAAAYAAAFTFGLFLTIALVGVVCALLGRMLGDAGPWWTIPVGAVLIWASLDMLGVPICSVPGGGSLMGRLKVRGIGGAFFLGLAYGVLSGSCTFGFIAPLLAVITLQGKVATGILLIVLFGIGHCIPVAAAGSGAALFRRGLEGSRFRSGSTWLRRVSGAGVAAIGIYFLIRPFLIGRA
ncbi:MAG: cytochrome c biogenesis protein CcdA [Thermodesulfobacteriota bacterium]